MELGRARERPLACLHAISSSRGQQKLEGKLVGQDLHDTSTGRNEEKHLHGVEDTGADEHGGK